MKLPLELRKSINATKVITNGAMMFGISHCGSAKKWSIW